MAHPPRSKLPRRSSSGPPNPCITPSTVTLVVVVNLMFMIPFFVLWTRASSTLNLGPSVRSLSYRSFTSSTNTPAPIRHRLLDFFRGRFESETVSRRLRLVVVSRIFESHLPERGIRRPRSWQVGARFVTRADRTPTRRIDAGKVEDSGICNRRSLGFECTFQFARAGRRASGHDSSEPRGHGRAFRSDSGMTK